MDTSSSTVSLKYQRATRNLARSPIHQSLQLSSTGAGHDAPPSSSSSCQNLSPQGKQNSLDTGITKAELQKSFVDCLTEPSSSTGAGKEAANGGLDRFKKQKLGVSLGLQVAVWLEQVVRVVRHFKVYLQHLGIALVTAVAVVLACSLRGDLMLFSILTYKTYYHPDSLTNARAVKTGPTNTTPPPENTSTPTPQPTDKILPDYLQLPDSYNLSDLLFYMAVGIASSQLMYQALCGFFQVYYYRMQRGEPEKWKCQPHRFLTRSNEIHEMVVGTANMFLAAGMSGFITCWIVNGNYSTVYFRIDDYGYFYFFFSILWLFVWLEACAFYSHAILHTPWLYKNIHKHHHRYHSPTAYSVIAMSPFELVFYDSLFLLPLFIFPIHGLVYVAELVYVYYFGLMDHSGIKMESWLPWQPDSMFHDDHHRYFHCNFGFNAYWFDRLHGTMRKKDRVYGETVFGGKGAIMKNSE